MEKQCEKCGRSSVVRAVRVVRGADGERIFLCAECRVVRPATTPHDWCGALDQMRRESRI